MSVSLRWEHSMMCLRVLVSFHRVGSPTISGMGSGNPFIMSCVFLFGVQHDGLSFYLQLFMCFLARISSLCIL